MFILDISGNLFIHCPVKVSTSQVFVIILVEHSTFDITRRFVNEIVFGYCHCGLRLPNVNKCHYLWLGDSNESRHVLVGVVDNCRSALRYHDRSIVDTGDAAGFEHLLAPLVRHPGWISQDKLSAISYVIGLILVLIEAGVDLFDESSQDELDFVFIDDIFLVFLLQVEPVVGFFYSC